MENPIPRIQLTSDYSISAIIKGGWQLAGGHGHISKHQAIEDMKTFVEAGITTFDCADIYTGVEELIGLFIKQYKDAFNSGELPYPQIHTKFVPDLDMLSSVSKSYTESIIDRSLKRLGVDRLDMVQFHWWDYSIKRYVDAAHYLEDLKKAGKIRTLSVTNFDAHHLKEIIDAGVDIVTNQVQYSVLDLRPEIDLKKLIRESGLKLLCYGTMAGGFLTERYLGPIEVQEPPENRSLTKYKLIINEFGSWDIFQDLLKTLKSIAVKHDVSIAEIVASYILNKSGVAGIIVGARNKAHLSKIQTICQLTLDGSDLQRISGIVSKARGPKGPVYDLERDRNGKHGQIMKYNLNKEAH